MSNICNSCQAKNDDPKDMGPCWRCEKGSHHIPVVITCEHKKGSMCTFFVKYPWNGLNKEQVCAYDPEGTNECPDEYFTAMADNSYSSELEY